MAHGFKFDSHDGGSIGISLKLEEGNAVVSIAKKILELENGKITLDSTPGAGTCFTVLLPAGAPHD